MKSTFRFFISMLAWLALGGTADAATLTWTNTTGGNWSAATNWSPNQVPGSSDDAVITASGTYAVTLDTSPTINSLTLGGSSGQQTLTTSNNNLNFNSASTVNSNGILALSGGNLSGAGPLTINGQLNWSGGWIALGSTLMVAANGTLVLEGVNSRDYSMAGVLTNAGTIELVSGNLQLVDEYNNGAGQLINLPGALVNLTANVSIDDAYGGELLINEGTVQKTGGTGTSTIYPIFDNTGTLDVQTGTVNVNGGGTGNGVFEADAGASLQIGDGYTTGIGIQFDGAGTNVVTGGTFTVTGTFAPSDMVQVTGGTLILNGLTTISNLVLAGGALAGNNGVIAGVLNWSGGWIALGSTLMVATNGTLVLEGVNGRDYSMAGVLTNAGTIELVSGNLQLVDEYNNGAGQLINLPGALVNLTANVSIDNAYGGELLINEGTVQKTGGTGTSGINVTLDNQNLLDVQTGTVNVNGGDAVGSTGIYQTESGATLAFVNNFTAYSGVQFTGIGSNLIASATFTLNGLTTISNLVLAGGTLAGNNGVIAGVLNWSGGWIALGSTLMVATNGTLVLEGVNGRDYSMAGVLTNAGTIELVSGNLQLVDEYNNGAGQLINLPGALVNLTANVSIDNAYGGELLLNEGTVQKTGGTGTSTIYPIFDNTGLLDVQTGTVSLNGGYTLTGGTLNCGINSLTSYGAINLPGSAALTGMVSANLNNGYQPIGGDSFSVLTYGSRTGIFTNTALPEPYQLNWQTNYGSTVFTLTVLNVRPTPVPIPNQVVDELTTLLVNAAATDPDIPAQTLTFGLATAPAGLIINPSSGTISWTPAQTQSPSTNTVVWTVTDSGNPPLTATNSFVVVVVEVNKAPVLPAIPNLTAYVGNLLTVVDTAMEPNIHSPTSGYSLIGAPSGMVVDTNGIITWTPILSQNASTNLVAVVVTNSNLYDTVNPQLAATNSFTVVVSPAVPPTITLQPTNATVLVGVTTNFIVAVAGPPRSLINGIFMPRRSSTEPMRFCRCPR